jgi:hypothetical protein
MAWRRRRQQQFAAPQQDTSVDANGNGYPDVFEAQEAQLLAQINARRKAYMSKMGQAEDQYVQSGGQSNDLGDTYDSTDVDHLFDGDILN